MSKLKIKHVDGGILVSRYKIFIPYKTITKITNRDMEHFEREPGCRACINITRKNWREWVRLGVING